MRGVGPSRAQSERADHYVTSPHSTRHDPRDASFEHRRREEIGLPSPKYDLLVTGGRVIDPAQGLAAPRDVAIVGHSIARVAPDLPRSDAKMVIDATGLVVTPGLIDVHVHVYDGVAPLGIPADPNCVAKGVTTVLDAGSAGAHTFPGFLKQVVTVVDTRVFALLNISVIGQASFSLDVPYGELLDLRYASPKSAIRVIEEHRDVILGVKVRLSREIAGENDLKALSFAKEAAAAAGLPVMVHIGNTHTSLPTILAMLGPGDVVTHTFHGRENGILDANGRVLDGVRAAVARGVLLDVGHGGGSFSFDVAEKALRQEIVPGTISSDLHRWSMEPVYDLATTLSKFMHLGLSLEQVIERATANPASAFGFPSGLGTLREGAEADVALFSILEGDFPFADAHGQTRVGHRKLGPSATIKAGRIYSGG
jgi:dihydroorotase